MNAVPIMRFTIPVALIALVGIVGVIFAIRGFWGTSRKARRLAVLSAILVLPLSLVFGVFVFLSGWRMITMLGPAATPRDMAQVFSMVSGPVVAGLVSCLAIAAVAGVGWARGPERRTIGDEPPPRRPAE